MSTTNISFQTLKSFTPFDTLNEEYLDRVVDQAKIKDYSQGALIFKRGKSLEESFYLVEGDIDLVNSQYATRTIHTQAEDRRLPLNNSSPSLESAVAKSPAKIMTVDRDFLDLVMAWSETGDVTEIEIEEPGFDKMPDTASMQSLTSYADEDESQCHDNDWMSCLLNSPLFTQIPPSNIEKLFTQFEAVNKFAGDVVISEGGQGDCFYVIESGAALVESKNGKINVPLSVGHFFGEEALVGDTTRNASVTMTKDGTLMRLSKDNFTALLSSPLLHWVTSEEVSQQRSTGTTLQLLDVRLPLEFRNLHVPDSQNIPLSSLRNKMANLDKETIYIVSDDAGRRSEVACHLLCQAGFDTYILKDCHQSYQQPG